MQGFNMGKYVPPDQEGTISGNRLNNKHALGARAAKLKTQGILTVRFEMPYAVWCGTCEKLHGKPAIIGQGVRFNAEKKKVGYYHSTPIWSFRMKHTACSGWIEIRTDPRNTAYVVTEGGKARDYGDDADRIREGEGGVPILTAEERERRREDAFAQLEGRVEEKALVKDNAKRIEELYRARERDWEDPAAANKRIRSTFRQERKVRKRAEEATEALKERLGTDMDLLPENEADALRAKQIEFGQSDAELGLVKAAAKPLFQSLVASKSGVVSAKKNADRRKQELRAQLSGNTRAAMNPFSSGKKREGSPGRMTTMRQVAGKPNTLVDYESD